MAGKRIAVLFDAENINCPTASAVLDRVRLRGTVQIRRAVGDFSSACLAEWIACSRHHGIELVLQPSLGKGKNSADIRLTIEAMDILHERGVDTIALVTQDRDFAPLASRLRAAGMEVWGFSPQEPSSIFAAACSSFEVIGLAPAFLLPPPASADEQLFTKGERARLTAVIAEATKSGPAPHHAIHNAILLAEPELTSRLGGKGKFLRRLEGQGLVERTGTGAAQMLKPAQKRGMA